jgi:hypothetical protein
VRPSSLYPEPLQLGQRPVPLQAAHGFSGALLLPLHLLQIPLPLSAMIPSPSSTVVAYGQDMVLFHALAER